MRQNTPHPKELKAKAHKLFAKGTSKQGSMDETSEQEKSHAVNVQKEPEQAPKEEDKTDVNGEDEVPVEVG